MPERIQLRRTKGWRMPEGAVKVDRSTRWGNPFGFAWLGSEREKQLCYLPNGEPVLAMGLFAVVSSDPRQRRYSCAEAFAAWIHGPQAEAREIKAAARAELRGKDLACWCPLDHPCHADVLLEIANAPS